MTEDCHTAVLLLYYRAILLYLLLFGSSIPILPNKSDTPI